MPTNLAGRFASRHQPAEEDHMTFISGVFIGIVIGACIGAVVIALLTMERREECEQCRIIGRTWNE